MPVPEHNLSTFVNNDFVETVNLLETDGVTPYDVAGYESITLYLKASNTASDESATTFSVGTGITVVNEVTGVITIDIPHADLTAAGELWYRVDVENSSGQVETAALGNLYVLSA